MISDKELPLLAERLASHLAKRKWQTGTINQRTTTISVPGGGSSGGSGDTGSGLDFVAAHPTNDPTVNRHKEFYSYNFGIVGDGTTDDGIKLLEMFDAVGEAGGGKCIVCSETPTGSIYINRTVSIYHSNIHVEFRSPVIYGAAGSLRIMGEYSEFTRVPGGTAVKLRAASYLNGSNETVLPLATGHGAYLSVGDKIVVRGQNDASGKAIEKDTTFVKSIATDDVTCTDELDYTFYPTYAGSDWPPDATTGTTIYVITFSAFPSNTSAGSVSVTVADAASFVIGSLVVISDNRTEYDMNSSAITGSLVPYKNPANLEIARVISVDTGTDVIGLDRALVRSYTTAAKGGVALLIPVRNSSISGARITYNADQTSKSINPLQITYAENCHIFDCVVDGLGGRRSQACRISYGYNCSAYDNVIRDAKFTASGEGYGITLYYTTLCRVHDNFIAGCRHNILTQLATLCDIYNNESRDDRISGIDCHGVRSYGIHIYGNLITRAAGTTSDSTKGSGIRIGNTSHSNGDFSIVVEDNVFVLYSSTDESAFDVVAASADVVFRNNTVFGAYIGFRFTLNSSQITPVQTATNITVESNRFIACTNNMMVVTGQPTYDGSSSNGKIDKLHLLNNTSDGNTNHFKITGASGVTNVRIESNRVINAISASSIYAYTVTDVAGLLLLRNSARGANRGISLTNCTAAAMLDNDLTGLITSTPYNDGGGNTSLLNLGNITDTGVGIGTASPAETLHVAGDIQIGDAVASTAASYEINMPAGSSTINSGNGRELYVQAGSSDNTAGKRGGHLYLRPGAPTSPATTYGAVLLADTGGNVGISSSDAPFPLTVDGAIVSRYDANTRYRGFIAGQSALAVIGAYDDTATQYIPLYIDGSTIYLRTGTGVGTTTSLDASGNLTLAGTINTGAAVLYTRVDGTLTASQTSTAEIPHDGTKPLITEGLQILSISYTPYATGNRVRISAYVPYVETSLTGAVQLAIFAGSTCIAANTRRITTGGSSGGDLEIVGDFVTSGVSALTIQARCGPAVNTTTLTFNSKFDGLSQPYMLIEEFV